MKLVSRSQEPKRIVNDAVQFTYPGRRPVWVPLCVVFEWADKQDLLWTPSMIRWHYEGEDAEHESFAKGWWASVGGKLIRVGAGAYGNGFVAEREAA